MQDINLTIKDIDINIKATPKVFPPSPHGTKALANVIEINQGEKVLDLGTGTGLLGILAAKMGGSVYVSDILKEAVELAGENALKNNVEIKLIQGDLFSPFKGENFDVIIANVPQEVFSPKLLKQYDKYKITSFHGGKDGTDVLIRTLKDAPEYMHKSSRLYVVVFTMSDFHKTLKYIVDNYSAKMINFYSGPVKDFVYEDLDWYLSNKDFYIYKVENEYFADLFVFELRQKNNLVF